MLITERKLRRLIRQILLEEDRRYYQIINKHINENQPVVNRDNIEEKMDLLERIYRGHFNWQLNYNKHSSNDNVLNYSVIMSEELVQSFWGATRPSKFDSGMDSGIEHEPPEDFADSELDPDFELDHDRTPENKNLLNFEKTRWGSPRSRDLKTTKRGSMQLNIERVRTNKRNEDPKWGGFKFSEYLPNDKKSKDYWIDSGRSAECFLYFIQQILVLTQNKISDGISPLEQDPSYNPRSKKGARPKEKIRTRSRGAINRYKLTRGMNPLMIKGQVYSDDS